MRKQECNYCQNNPARRCPVCDNEDASKNTIDIDSNLYAAEKTLVNQLSLSWGVRAFHYSEEESLDDIIKDEIEILRERGFVKSGDVVVNTGSLPVHLYFPTNML